MLHLNSYLILEGLIFLCLTAFIISQTTVLKQIYFHFYHNFSCVYIIYILYESIFVPLLLQQPNVSSVNQ